MIIMVIMAGKKKTPLKELGKLKKDDGGGNQPPGKIQEAPPLLEAAGSEEELASLAGWNRRPL